MLNPGYTTISKFLIQQVPEGPHGRELAALLVDVAAVIKAISVAVGKGPLLGLASLAGSENSQGEPQKQLDVLADEMFARGVEWSGLVGALASEEMEDVHFVEGHGRLALVFDPLDGSANLDLNVPVGSIFSILALAETARGTSAVLQPGARQLAAGYAIYGPATHIVISVGRGTHGFTLDREIGNFVLTHPDIRIPEEGSEYAGSGNRRSPATWTSARRGATGREAATSTRAGSPRWSRTFTASCSAAASTCTRVTRRRPPARAGCGCSTRRTRWRCSSSRPVAPPRRGGGGSSRSSPSACTSASR